MSSNNRIYGGERTGLFDPENNHFVLNEPELIVFFEKRFDCVRMIEQPDPLFLVKSHWESAETIDRNASLFTYLQTQLTRPSLLDLFA